MLWPLLGAQVCTRSPSSSAWARHGPAHRGADGVMTDPVRCPICNSEAAEIDRGLFDGVGFDCRFHGRFRVSGTVLAQGTRGSRRQWEHALMLAKARASDGPPLISSELL